MICIKCKFNVEGYCKIFKIKVKTLPNRYYTCIKFRERKERLTKINIKKISIKQEKKLAKLLGAKLTPASGALSGRKGDMVKGKYLIESKSTENDRIMVRKSWLKKLNGYAIKEGKVPVLALDFKDNEPYFILNKNDFLEIINGREK